MMPGKQLEETRDALLDAFDEGSLAQMLRLRLDRRLGRSVPTGSLEQMVFALLERSEREGWTADLIREAHRYVPGNARLREVYEKYRAATETVRVEQDQERKRPGWLVGCLLWILALPILVALFVILPYLSGFIGYAA